MVQLILYLTSHQSNAHVTRLGTSIFREHEQFPNWSFHQQSTRLLFLINVALTATRTRRSGLLINGT